LSHLDKTATNRGTVQSAILDIRCTGNFIRLFM